MPFCEAMWRAFLLVYEYGCVAIYVSALAAIVIAQPGKLSKMFLIMKTQEWDAQACQQNEHYEQISNSTDDSNNVNNTKPQQ